MFFFNFKTIQLTKPLLKVLVLINSKFILAFFLCSVKFNFNKKKTNIFLIIILF